MASPRWSSLTGSLYLPSPRWSCRTAASIPVLLDLQGCPSDHRKQSPEHGTPFLPRHRPFLFPHFYTLKKCWKIPHRAAASPMGHELLVAGPGRAACGGGGGLQNLSHTCNNLVTRDVTMFLLYILYAEQQSAEWYINGVV